MNKLYKINVIIIFIFLLMFLFINNVKAADAKCVYDLYNVNGTPGTGPVKETVTIEFKDSKLSFSWVIAPNTRRTAFFTNNSKDIDAMRTLNGVLRCPEQIYFGLETSSAGAKYYFSFSKDSLQEYGSPISNPINSNSSSVNNDPDPGEDAPAPEEVTCKYKGDNTIVFNKNSKNVSVFLSSTTYGDCPNSNYNHLISQVENSNYACPSNLCVSKGSGGPYGTLCTVSFSNQGAPGTICYGYSEGTADPSNNGNEPNNPIHTGGEVTCD
ncbi:MAG: hypothetical protein PHR09_03530, partial [Bacilli bacterium]|nr:hypothetical protein [Bacilli bacterium]